MDKCERCTMGNHTGTNGTPGCAGGDCGCSCRVRAMLAGIGYTVERVHEIPADAPRWAHEPGQRAWRYVLTYNGREMVGGFYQGSGHTAAPTMGDVLECLASDAAIVAGDELDDVLGDMPYSEARAVADALEQQTAALRTLMGDEFELLTYADRDLIERAS